MASSEPLSTHADVASPAFIDKDNVEGDHSSSSIRAVMINRPRRLLYDVWRNFENLPSFTENIKEVETINATTTHWVVSGPGEIDIDLVAEVTEDIPGERIAWRSTENSDIDHEGWIEFRDNAFGRGTEVRAFLSYDPPAGVVGKVVAKVMQREPRIQIRRELRRFKQLMETGEVSTSKAPDAAPRADRHV
jgi:uncharacterized membrane protein